MVSSVLVVDDDPAFLMLVARILADIGVEVVDEAGDGGAAMEAATRNRPEAVLLDVGLPDRHGIELGYELAALPWRPRVVLTSTDRAAAAAVDPPAGREKLPFIPKEELVDGVLRGLLTAK